MSQFKKMIIIRNNSFTHKNPLKNQEALGESLIVKKKKRNSRNISNLSNNSCECTLETTNSNNNLIILTKLCLTF